MPLPQLRTALPWLLRLSLIASLFSLALALYLGLASRDRATRNATSDMAVRADTLGRQLEADLTLFDLALHEAANPAPRTNAAKASFPELPLTGQYLGFMNVLNEVGDVVADFRSTCPGR